MLAGVCLNCLCTILILMLQSRLMTFEHLFTPLTCRAFYLSARFFVRLSHMGFNTLHAFVTNSALYAFVMMLFFDMLAICFVIFELPGAKLTWKELLMISFDMCYVRFIVSEHSIALWAYEWRLSSVLRSPHMFHMAVSMLCIFNGLS